jgi:hypothetical protein
VTKWLVAVLGGLVVAGLLAAWWLRNETARSAPVRSAPGPAPIPAPIEAALEQPHVIEATPQREALAGSTVDEAPLEPEAPKAQREELDEAVLVVQAIDQVTRAPLPGVRMSLALRTGRSSSTFVESAKGSLDSAPVSGGNGRVEFAAPAGVELRLWARGDDVGRRSVDVEPLAPLARRELTIELPTGDDLRYFARVLARDDRSPVAGARIEIVRSDTWYTQVGGGEEQTHTEENLLASTEADADGLFELTLASWKEPDIRISAPGFAMRLLHAARGHETPEQAKVVLLARASSLRALLLDSAGAPVDEGSVRLWTESYHIGEADHGEVYLPSMREVEWTGDADVTGRCTFTELPPDVPLHVEIWRGTECVKRDLPDLSLTAGETREIEWRIGSGCTLTGLVVDQHGEPVTNQELWLQRAEYDAPRFFQAIHSGEVVVEAHTDPDGRFVFSDVSAGRWWLGPASERNDWDPVDPSGIAPAAQVVEVLERTSVHEVQLRVYRGLYIRGLVLDPESEPAPETYLYGSNEGIAWMLSARTGSDGTFVLGPLVPGRYSLVAHGWISGHADSDPVEASEEDLDIVLRLKAGGSLRGTVIDEATGSTCAARVTCTRMDGAEGFMASEADDEGRIQGSRARSLRHHRTGGRTAGRPPAGGQRAGRDRDRRPPAQGCPRGASPRGECPEERLPAVSSQWWTA